MIFSFFASFIILVSYTLYFVGVQYEQGDGIFVVSFILGFMLPCFNWI